MAPYSWELPTFGDQSTPAHRMERHERNPRTAHGPQLGRIGRQIHDDVLQRRRHVQHDRRARQQLRIHHRRLHEPLTDGGVAGG